MTALQTRPRLLTDADVGAVSELVGRDPVLNCVLQARVAAAPDLDAHRLGGRLWGVDDEAAPGLRAVIYHGGNLIPIGADLGALTCIADTLGRSGRWCSSIVGPADSVEAIWPALSARWGPARIIRSRQPFMVTSRAPDLVPDPTVRAVRPDEVTAFLPAAVAMFTEELETSPLSHDRGTSYRARVADLIGAGRAFARFDRRGRVEFKAEIGALGANTAQIQGVWVRPDLRGQGLGTAAMAQVLCLALQMAPSASLYVNEFNTVARKMYERLGMRQTQTLSTVLY